jgi:hypothetical protein
MECQNRTISRGSASIFSRLRKEGIDVSPTNPCVARLPIYLPETESSADE